MPQWAAFPGALMKRIVASVITVLLVAGGLIALRAQAPAAGQFNEQLLRAFAYRNVGPFRMQARIAAIDVPAKPAKDHLYTFYTAPWSGGGGKTTNNGTTFDPLFDRETTQSIGDVTVAPSDSNIVWVGTGDA